MKVFLTLALYVTLIISSSFSAFAQTFHCTIQNLYYPTPNTLEFDIFITNTGSNLYKLSSFQLGIDFNYTGMANGGTITGSFIAGSNNLPAPQNNLSSNTSVNATSKQFRVTQSLVNNPANAASLTSIPLKYGRFRLTNTVNFPANTIPFFLWSFVQASNKTKTSMACFVNGSSTPSVISTQTSGGCPYSVSPIPPCTHVYAPQQGPQFYVNINEIPCAYALSYNVTQPVCYGETGSVTVPLSRFSAGNYVLDNVVHLFNETDTVVLQNLALGAHTLFVEPTGYCATLSAYVPFNFTISGPSSNINSSTIIAACDSYTWNTNNITYTQSGTYSNGFINASGCTVYDELQLTINQSTTNSQTITACGNYLWPCNGNTYTQSGTYTCNTTNAFGCTHTEMLQLTIPSCNALLSAQLFLQGYYESAGNMRPVLANQMIGNSSTACDTIEINLRNPSPPYAVVYTTKGMLTTNGMVEVNIPDPFIGSSYFLVVSHRNHLETWSSNPITITSTTTYPFSSSASQAYGSNQIHLGSGVYGFYAGDINQDNVVDAFDFSMLEPDIITGTQGYLATDVDGDGIVDAFDYLLIADNIINGVTTTSPE